MQSSGLKAAHFYAPRGPNKHHVSGSVPPGLSLLHIVTVTSWYW